MDHYELLQYLINTYNYQSYLEIGTEYGYNFSKINCLHKECCDIDNTKFNNITYHMTSDEMFERMSIDNKYDIIFIDGMHDEDYVDRDIINSLKHLNPGGVVCIHDVIPNYSSVQKTYELVESPEEIWTGNVWKSITKLEYNNLEFYTVLNYDFGLTIIKYKENPYLLKLPNHKSPIQYKYVFNDDYDFFKEPIENHMTFQGNHVLHCINIEKFKEIFNGQ